MKREKRDLREIFTQGIAELNENQLIELMGAINAFGEEYGWGERLETTRFIEELWNWKDTQN